MSANQYPAGVEIHPTAIVAPGAKLAAGVKIGPYSIIGENVELGENCIVKNHVTIEGHTKIGKNNQFFQYASIGAPPQDLTYKGEPTEVIIGDNNVFRECMTVHRGTLKQDKKTVIGNDSLFMAYVHIGHDVVIEDKVVIVNSVNLAGHVHIGTRCIIGGATNVSQFCTLGRGSYIGGATAIDRDIPPFCTAYGNRVKLKGINIVGLRRHGYSKQEISEVVDFYRTMESSAFSPRAFVEHDETMKEYNNNKIIAELVEFIKKTEIGIAPFLG